jgi:hypothetical protein
MQLFLCAILSLFLVAIGEIVSHSCPKRSKEVQKPNATSQSLFAILRFLR